MLADLAPLLWSLEVGLTVSAVGYALVRRRGFTSTISWVLAAIAIPFVGAIAYFLLANPIVRRTRRRKALATERVRGGLAACGDLGEALAHLTPGERSLITMAVRLTGMPVSAGNRLELLSDGAAAFRLIEDAVRAARRLVWAEYYIVQDDATGRHFLDLLTERARAGVDVRLLYDAVGSAGLDPARLAALSAAGGRAEAFHPVNPLRRRWAVHLRNHRKIIVVDGEVGFTGGMNVGDEYSGRGPRKRPWRDTHLLLRGPAVRDLAEVFDEDWAFTTDELLELPLAAACADGGSVVTTLPSGPDQELNATGLVYFAGIAGATSRCWLTSPYFVPDEPNVQALVSAALRGVDVRVLVPRDNDLPLLAPAMRSYYPRLVQGGVKVYEYLPTMLHAKTMAVDGDFALVGSANLDMRSFRLNFEASVLVFDRRFTAEIERQFEADLAASEPVTEESLARRGLIAAVAEGAAQLLSPIF